MSKTIHTTSNDTKKSLNQPVKRLSYEEVLQACLNYFKDDELAATTWMNKYAIKHPEGGYIEHTPEDMHWRMANEFARIEQRYAQKTKKDGLSVYGKTRKALDKDGIFQLFKGFKYLIPQGSVMSALGHPFMTASLSNCVVLPSPYDSYGGIMHTDQQLTQLFKRRCGVGIDISKLRPAQMAVNNSAGTTTGAVSFMERFSNTTREVAQNGRRGALMITIDVTHPDVMDFISSKRDLTKITGANISVRLNGPFMKAVNENKNFTLKWPVNSENPEITKEVPAREIWDAIIENAHATAEPGLIFWDHQHHYSTSSVYPGFENESTNPCSEIAMQGGDSCRLMALNLYNFVEQPFTPQAKFNFKKFYEVTYESQRLSDDLVELEIEAVEKILKKVESDPEPEHIKKVELDTWKLLLETGKKGRRTGLGFTALADALAALNLKFDSDAAIEAIDAIMKEKCRAEFDASIDLSIERGAFAGFDPNIENTSDFVKMLHETFPELYERMMKHGRRNISISTVAPTGTLSLLAQTSAGIEPVFMKSYKRRRKIANPEKETPDFVDDMGDAWKEFTVYHPKMKNWMEVTGKNNEDLSPYAGATAPEIDWEKRIQIQAAVQKYTTHSISSTINLPEDTSTDLVSKIYLHAWKEGLKGITVYRDGSRTGVLVSEDDNKAKKEIPTAPKKRPEVLETSIVRFMNEKEKWLAFIGINEGQPYEIFTGKEEDSFSIPAYVKTGWIIKSAKGDHSRYDFKYQDRQGYYVTIEGLSRSFNKEYWNYAKLISGVLRHQMQLIHVVDLVENLNTDNEYINTWKNGVARALKTFIPDGTAAIDKACPSCNDQEGLVYQEGCKTCRSCGYSKCG